MIDIVKEIFDTVAATVETLNTTCENINSIDFEDSELMTWLGYAHYAMGTPLYVLFTTVTLIGVGVSLWSFMLKGISYIRNLLPW
jgi:hypothetical protein